MKSQYPRFWVSTISVSAVSGLNISASADFGIRDFRILRFWYPRPSVHAISGVQDFGYSGLRIRGFGYPRFQLSAVTNIRESEYAQFQVHEIWDSRPPYSWPPNPRSRVSAVSNICQLRYLRFRISRLPYPRFWVFMVVGYTRFQVSAENLGTYFGEYKGFVIAYLYKIWMVSISSLCIDKCTNYKYVKRSITNFVVRFLQQLNAFRNWKNGKRRKERKGKNRKTTGYKGSHFRIDKRLRFKQISRQMNRII